MQSLKIRYSASTVLNIDHFSSLLNHKQKENRMENIESSTQRSAPINSIPYLDKEHGYYASASVTNAPDEIYQFCQDNRNIEKVLRHLPSPVKNFLQLNLASAEQIHNDEFRIEWKNNSNHATKGFLTFLIKGSPLRGGSIITVEAVFDKIKFKEEGPSTLMNIFLKRMKGLMETGVIATTMGQPCGREELHTIH
jgi:hypothetical protein